MFRREWKQQSGRTRPIALPAPLTQSLTTRSVKSCKWKSSALDYTPVLSSRFYSKTFLLSVLYTTYRHARVAVMCNTNRNLLKTGRVVPEIWMNEWIFYSATQTQYSRNSKEQNCVDWTDRLKEHLQQCPMLTDRQTDTMIVILRSAITGGAE